MPLGLMLLDSSFEAVTRDQTQNLAEDAAYSFQGGASSVEWIRSSLELNSNYQRLHLSPATNLDTSDAQWNGALLAEALNDVSSDQVWRVLRKHGIQLQRRRSWCITTDPEFGPKAADVVGLYLNPPEKAVVLCVDEKPHIQALQRAQGYLRMPDGKAVNGFSHCYKRHGTTTLFAALDVATGQVTTGHYARRRRREFLDFMNEVVAENAGKEIHVILDNLNTHKPKRDRWLKVHPQVHLHFTPTYSSWLNQVECWFSILSRSALRGGSFTSARQLREAIDAFVKVYNDKATPFEWTKAVVRQSSPKRLYSDLCK
jgi:transposase